MTYLKESLDPPNLKNTLSKQYNQLKQTPPLDASIRTLRRISMGPLPHHDVSLLILDLPDQFGQLSNLLFERIMRRIGFWDIDNPVYIERDFLGICGPVFVGEAVDVFAIHLGCKRVVAVGDCSLVELETSLRICHLVNDRVSH